MIVAWVQTLVLTRLPSACCFPDLFQSMYMQNAFHLCLHSRRIELASTTHLLRGHVAIITKLSPHYILTESNHFQSVMQFDPRPSPDFSPQLRDKIWEWPGDEATDNPQNMWVNHYNCISKIWCFVVILSQMFSGYYLQDNGMLFDTCRCDLFQRCMISDSLRSFLSGCLMQLANKQYITTVSSACLQPW